MNNNHVYMHGYYSPCKWLFYSFFLSPLSNYFPSPTFTTTQRARIRRRKKKITTQPPNLAPPPNTATYHRKLTQNQQKINPKSTEKQLENPTQNQSKLTSKSNPKTVQTHWKTQHKPYLTENSCEMPNGAGSAAIATARWSSIVAVGSSIAVVD